MSSVELISLYSTLFYIGLAIAAIGLIAAVAMFFLFDIPKVFVQVTGRGGKKMDERDGKAAHSKRKKEKKPRAIERPVANEVHVAAEDVSTEVLSQTDTQPVMQDDLSTTILNDSSQDTTVLSEGSQETAILGEPQSAEQYQEESASTTILGNTQPQINFEITESLIWVHTDEKI